MKSQGLPMTTIALIIIVLIVLAGVAIFFFSYFAKSQSGVDAMTCFQLCAGEQAKFQNTKTVPTAANTQYCKNGCVTYGPCIYNTSSGASFNC